MATKKPSPTKIDCLHSHNHAIVNLDCLIKIGGSHFDY